MYTVYNAAQQSFRVFKSHYNICPTTHCYGLGVSPFKGELVRQCLYIQQKEKGKKWKLKHSNKDLEIHTMIALNSHWGILANRNESKNMKLDSAFKSYLGFTCRQWSSEAMCRLCSMHPNTMIMVKSSVYLESMLESLVLLQIWVSPNQMDHCKFWLYTFFLCPGKKMRQQNSI